MEIASLNRADSYLDFDLERRGIILEKDVFCGYCNIRMDKISQNMYRCSRCGQEYIKSEE